MIGKPRLTSGTHERHRKSDGLEFGLEVGEREAQPVLDHAEIRKRCQQTTSRGSQRQDRNRSSPSNLDFPRVSEVLIDSRSGPMGSNVEELVRSEEARGEEVGQGSFDVVGML
jgi:hypothetical protein